MKNRLSNELYRYDAEEFGAVHDPRILDESFETIKIQLLAQGLIRKSQRKHVASDTNRYWSLTPYGENYLMKLRAILKGSSTEIPF